MTYNAKYEVQKPSPSNKKSAVGSIVFNIETYGDELEIVQIINEHFSTVAKTKHDSIPVVTTGYNFTSYLADIPSHEYVRFASLSATVNENAIMSLKKQKKYN